MVQTAEEPLEISDKNEQHLEVAVMWGRDLSEGRQVAGVLMRGCNSSSGKR